MRRTLLSFPILAFAGVAMTSNGCSSSSIPIGEDAATDGAASNGGDSGGTVSCGTATCGQGELCCAGTDPYCTPTCTRVTSCPVLGRSCLIPDGGGTVDSGMEVDGQPASDAGSSDAQAGSFSWYQTCGDPSCQLPTSDAGLTSPDGGACPAVGSTCSTAGDTCGTRNAGIDCGATLVCAAHDPKAGIGGCPISSREFKDGIEYVDPAGLEQLHDQTLRIRLATYNYKAAYADPKPKRLGFIIEDNPASPAVDPAHDSIELYGYLSMVVATMQVQEKEIASLKRELAETRRAARSLPAR
jgi:hypothetical protein